MALCPKDFQPCCDDLCRAGMSCFVTGMSMYKICHGGCGKYVAIDGTDSDNCTCDPGDGYYSGVDDPFADGYE